MRGDTSRARCVRPSWITCDGAMPVAAALRAAGSWNTCQPRDLDSEDWWYKCRFSAVDADGPVRLRFEGLATVADAWLNGEHILHSENMFVAHDVDIPRLVAGQNELVPAFSGACSAARADEAPPSEVANESRRTPEPALVPDLSPRANTRMVSASGAGRPVETDLPGHERDRY